MNEPKTLCHAVSQTEPGRHSQTISQILYDYESRPLPEDERKQLYAIRDYLERLAHTELTGKVAKWVTQLNEKLASNK